MSRVYFSQIINHEGDSSLLKATGDLKYPYVVDGAEHFRELDSLEGPRKIVVTVKSPHGEDKKVTVEIEKKLILKYKESPDGYSYYY